MVTLAPTASIMVYTSDGKLALLWVSIRLPAQVPTWMRGADRSGHALSMDIGQHFHIP